MPIAAPDSTLQAIQTKVRRLTRSPSEAQLTDADLQNYINTFVVYDFPEHLRMFNLRTQFTFWCNPYQDQYPTDTSTNPNNPLYNFQNLYISMSGPVYIAGYQSFFSQSREQFFGVYPLTNSIASINQQGNGVTTTFSGVINSQQSIVPPGVTQQVCLLKDNVLFSSVDLNGNGLSMVDVPVLDASSLNPTIYGNLYIAGQQPATPPIVSAPYSPMGPCNADSTNCIDPFNYINYTTGEFTVTFPYAPRAGWPINSQTIPQIVSLPQAILYYDDVFTVRPVPDQPYAINFEAYIRPTYLMSTDSQPALNEWWQYISYGAAKKIFEDRMDIDSVTLILPEYRKQENLCLRRTIVQYTNERTATIYNEQTGQGSGFNGWGQGGGSF